jgi:hypothetical protein
MLGSQAVNVLSIRLGLSRSREGRASLATIAAR